MATLEGRSGHVWLGFLVQTQFARRLLVEKTKTYTLSVLIFAAIVAMLPNSVLFPATRDIAAHLHVPDAFVGLMVTAYSVAYVIATPVLGVLSDQVGRRFVLVGGLTLFAIGGVFPLFTGNHAVILTGRAVMGIGSAGILPMTDSLIGDMYAEGQPRRSALAAFGAAIAVADAIVPFSGGLLDTWHWQAVFGIYTLGFAAAVCCLYIAAPPLAHHQEGAGFRDYVQGLRVAARIPSLVAALVCAMLFGVVYFGICALLPLALVRNNNGLTNGMLFLPIGIAWVLTSAFLSRRTHLNGVHLYASLAAVALAVAALWMSSVHTLAPLLCTGIVWGVGAALITTLCTWVVGDDAPAMVRGAMNAVYNAAYVLGFAVGAPVFMWFDQLFGYAAAVRMAGAGMLLVAVTSYFWLRSADRSAQVASQPDAAVHSGVV